MSFSGVTGGAKGQVSRPHSIQYLEAHNAVSARVVEEAGFDGVWASSLTISAALGARDCNEISWTQTLDTAEYMVDACSIPVLLDADTGYGNYNNVRRLVTKAEQRGLAGVCIEDQVFPKRNSLLDDGIFTLADPSEFAGKIRAATDTRTRDGFTIVARVEALVAGLGVAEAMRRAELYRIAGADAIVIHTRDNTVAEVREFVAEWADRLPLIAIPTTYYRDPAFKDLAFRFHAIIWANHTLRSAVAAMQLAARQLRVEGNPASLEESMIPVAELFRLQNLDELTEADSIYLPPASATGTS